MKAIFGKNILTQAGLGPACIIIENGVIKDVHPELPKSFTGTAEDMGNLLVMPGVVDPHVHINEPGRTEWEGFECATRAAAAGGITTVVDMPLNCDPVTIGAEALKEKIKHMRDRLWVDVGLWGGATPGSLDKLPALINAGVLGVKSFLIDSGLPDFPPMDGESLIEAVEIIAKAQIPYLIHAELNRSIGAPPIEITGDYRTFLNSRPRKWENDAIDLLIGLARKHHCKIHIVHLSSSDRLNELRLAKNEGVPITVETCPHYLTISAATISAGKTLYKCCPPIREESNKEKLWEGLKNGTIDYIASDHSPCTPALKYMQEGDMARAWGGISSLQLSLPLIWTEARKRNIPVELVAQWMSSRPAECAGLKNKKGEIAKGRDADLVVWDPQEKFQVTRNMLYHRHQETPYLGRTLYGVVHKTFLRGFKIYDHGRFSHKGLGEVLLKEKKKWSF